MTNKKEERLGLERINTQGCLMKIIEYNSNRDIIVEFQDEYKEKVHTSYINFQNGQVKNPYHPSVYGIGTIGDKYPCIINNKTTEEYGAWVNILKRCNDLNYKKRKPTYQNAVCCNEWLYYPNFYEWLHKQSNFKKWLKGYKWGVDKDILIKGNKVYSPETCCLVPENVNLLFIKSDGSRGNLPIGVTKHGNKYQARCRLMNDNKYLGNYNTPEKAFLAYKKTKESYIKQVAQEEYTKGNITKRCYEAMMNYEVEITD